MVLRLLFEILGPGWIGVCFPSGLGILRLTVNQGLTQALEILGILFFKGEHNVLRLQP